MSTGVSPRIPVSSHTFGSARLALVSALLTLVFVPSGFSRMPGDYVVDPAFASVDYTSALVSSHVHQRFALFRPAGAPPTAGAPVVILVSNSGLASSDPCYSSPITSASVPIYQFLDAGFTVARACLTSSDSFGDPSPCVPYPDLTSAALGNGLFHPPGVTLPGFSTAPYSDHGKPMAEKDCVMLVQHVRHNAATYGLDSDRIALTGRSGGAIISMWCAAGPERGAVLFPGGTGQDAESTRVDAGVFLGPPLYLQAFAQAQFAIPHFPKRNAGFPWTTPAATLLEALPSFQDGASALVFEAPAHALNAAQRLYFSYAEPYESTNFSTPYIKNTLTSGHSAWFGYAWKTLHPQSRLVITNVAGQAPGGGEDAFLPDRGDLTLDMIRYLRDEMAVVSPVTHPYDDGMPATDVNGDELTPLLTGSGEFAGSDAPHLGLSLARPSSNVVLMWDDEYLGAPLLGGILGPKPDNPGIALMTDSDGTLKFAVPAAAMPPGSTIYVQAWITDADGPQGFTASNTIRIDH